MAGEKPNPGLTGSFMSHDDAKTWAEDKGIRLLLQDMSKKYCVSDYGPYADKYVPGHRRYELDEHQKRGKLPSYECNAFSVIVFEHLIKTGAGPRAAPRVERVHLSPFPSRVGGHNFVLLNRKPAPENVNDRFTEIDITKSEFADCVLVDGWLAAMGGLFHNSFRMLRNKEDFGKWLTINQGWNPVMPDISRPGELKLKVTGGLAKLLAKGP